MPFPYPKSAEKSRADESVNSPETGDGGMFEGKPRPTRLHASINSLSFNSVRTRSKSLRGRRPVSMDAGNPVTSTLVRFTAITKRHSRGLAS
jgi:hypothetical protein